MLNIAYCIKLFFKTFKMGAGCYKEKTYTIQRDVILQAIQQQYLNDTILTENIGANDSANSLGVKQI